MQFECAILSSVSCPCLTYFFPQMSHKRRDFQKRKKERKKEIEKDVYMYFVLFPLQLLSPTFLILRTQRVMLQNVHKFACELRVILPQILMQFEYSRQIFRKILSIKLHENLSRGSRVFPCGPTNIHADGDTQRS